ncbi:hypothetical protein PYW07_006335 [Mythimna separata]|uniref:Hemolin n=1 Tax=Mythimna separata TaxID=271217 RepID=A0AAD7YVL4_MYTSE|nr:hypothetical protein PYW07_006335 [Mythimna separata]
MWGRIYPHLVLLIFVNIILKTSCQGNGSITFLIDDTSSMEDDIKQVRKSVHRIKEIVLHEKSSLIDNMVLVTLNDPGVHERIVTKDPNKFKSALDDIHVHNEARRPYLDCWEPAMKGLLLALEKSKNNSYIFVFTDAPAKDYIDSQSVIELCQHKQTQIIFVLTGTLCSKFTYVPAAIDSYFDIATACSGLAIFVKKNEVDKVFGPIEEIIKGNKTMITTVTIPADVSKIIPFTVDGYTDYVIIYSYGKNVSLKVNQRSISTKAIMWTDNAKVLKLPNIKPGTYTATVKGSSRTTISVVGRTDFFFNHGFSESKPKSPSDTSPQPMSDDTKVYLSISISDDKHSVKIVSAQFLDMNEKPIANKMSLTEVSKDFYITDPFIAPSQRFKVAVSGIVIATGQPITRISKIPVTPPPPKVPPQVQGVTTMKVNKNNTAQIECKVMRGFPAPKISWLFENQSRSTFTLIPKASDSVLVITKVEYKHDGKYKCIAENVKGKDEHVTTLHVQDPPQIVSISTVYEGTEGDTSLKVPCDATGSPKPSITWKLNNRVITKNTKYSIDNGALIIRDPKLSDPTSYKCEAKNELGTVSAFFKIYVRQKPKVSGVSAKEVRIGGSARFECNVIKGEPKPTITWEFKDNSGTKFLKISGSDKVLHISRAENKHTGSYKCVAKNKVGTDEHITTLEVQDKPSIKSSVSTVYESTEGEALLKIPCVTTGVPKPSITWKLNKRVIYPSAKYSIEDGTLKIRDPKLSDTNSYTCEAKNKLGAVSATFKAYIWQKPQVSGVPAKQVKVGSSASIECTIVKGEPKPTITWQFMNKLSSKFVTTGASERVLYISRVELKHAGRYKCVARNSVGSDEHVTTLDVQEAPQVSGVAAKKVRIGSSTSIECTVVKGEPKPTITWQFMDGSSTKFISITGSDKELHISRVESKHAGRYKCVAQNSVGSDEHVTTLVVQELPKIVSSYSTIYESTEGDTLMRIPCNATGLPEPSITWKLGDRVINPDAKYSLDDGTLIIRSPKVSDTNSYTCEAKNEVGADRATFKAYIRQVPILKGVHTVKARIGAATKIECTVNGEPKPTIKWQFMDKSSSTFLSVPESDEVLHISMVASKHAGRYKCIAQNNVGTNEHVTTLEVQDPPRISSATTIFESTEGDALLKIPCSAAGLPVPSITWKADDLVIKPSAKYTIEDGTLVIRNPKKSDTNSYTCEAKNEAGAVSATFKAYIRQIPKLKGEDSKNVKIGTPVKIECIIDQGEPTPKISWQFMDKNALKFVPITGSENVFHISNAENKHAGRYKCVAQNSVGSDEHVTTLTVEYLREITINSTTVEGILGDLALRIPCKVDGVPPPVITWKKNGNTITLNEKYSIEDGALVIVKPAASDSSSYTCEAMNSMGSTSATFQATVRRLPKNFGTEHYVYLKEGENKKLECEAYTSESQSVKWSVTKDVQIYFLSTPAPLESDSTETTTVLSTTEASSTKRQTTELNNTEPYIQIANASSWDHDGNYTCHVSDKHGNTQTHTYVVDVGMPPKFKFEDNVLNYWRGDTADIVQYCDIEENAKPTPVVQWSFNGQVLTDLNSEGVGQYTCNVSNVHGYVLKRLDVKSPACLITRNLYKSPYTPLVLNDEGFWHKLETIEYYMIVEQKMKITLSCPSLNETPNSFKTFPKKSTLDAICYKEDSFIVDDKTYKFSDLQCTDSIQPSVIKTKVKCSTETSELIRVGYNVPGFLEAYEVCFDHKSNMPSYTRILMTETNYGLNGVHNWYTHPGIGSKQTERGFTCKDASSSCCYSKSQLRRTKSVSTTKAICPHTHAV